MLHLAPNLIPYSSELGQHLFFRTFEGIGIVEAYVEALSYLSCKNWTCLFGTSADGDDVIPLVVEVLVERLGVMMADVYADFVHHLDAEWMNLSGRFGASRTDVPIGMKMLEYALSHLAAATVTGAYDEDVHVVKDEVVIE